MALRDCTGGEMPRLGAAVRTVHADPDWWRKVLIGGALWLTIVGWPCVEGHQLESLENSQRGFPTPLPRWHGLINKAVIGAFALVIDFFFFVFPLLIGSMIVFCAALGTGLSGAGNATRYVAWGIVTTMALYLLAVWLSGASAVAKQHYVKGDDMQRVISTGVIRETLSAPGRRAYLRARLHSLPPYLAAVAALGLAWAVADRSALAGGVLTWISLSILVYARLIAVQLYLSASRDVERMRFDMLS